MGELNFQKAPVHLIGFCGGIPDRLTRAKPLYRITNRAQPNAPMYAIGDLFAQPICTTGKNTAWLTHLYARRSVTRLTPTLVEQDVSVIVVAHATLDRLDQATPHWRDKLMYTQIEKSPAYHVVLPVQGARDYLGNVAKQLRISVDALLKQTTNTNVDVWNAESLAWIAWDCLDVSDTKHRHQIMVRILAAHRDRTDTTAKLTLDRLRLHAARNFSVGSLELDKFAEAYLKELRK